MEQSQERKTRKTQIVKEYLLPFLGQFAVLVVCIGLHRLFVGRGGPLGVPELVGDEMSSPTVGRLIYAILSCVLFLILTILASKQAKTGKEIQPFWLGMFAGTFLWQSIGEDLWHFTLDGVHFVQLESIAVLPFVILFLLLLIYTLRNQALDWGILCTMLSFACNWLGHYVMLGSYPFVSAFVDEKTWYALSGCVVGALALLVGIYCGVKKADSRRQRLLAAVLTYIAVGVIAFGLIG